MRKKERIVAKCRKEIDDQTFVTLDEPDERKKMITFELHFTLPIKTKTNQRITEQPT